MLENPQESFRMLLEACVLLSSKLDLADLLKAILSLASRVVESETASLLLLDPATQELYFHVALGLDPKVSRTRLKIGQGIVGKVAQGGKPVIINDVRADPQWNPDIDQQSGFQTRSILAAPMKIKGKLVGVVEAINHVSGPFSEGDLRIFEAFASQAAVAIDNAQLFASLNEEKTKLNTAFSHMRDGILMADERGAVLMTNPAANRLLGCQDGAARSLSEILAQTRITPPLDRLDSASNEPVPLEIVRNQPKTLVLAGAAFAFKFEELASGRSSLIRFLVFRDVTEERQEEFLKRNFLSLVSHKLKTPLACIMGFSDLLLGESGLPSATVKSLETISANAKRLTDLVEELLDFTTLESLDPARLKPEVFPVHKAVREALASLRVWLESQKAQVTVEVPKEATAYGDFPLIREALRHLIENGVKFNTKQQKSLVVRSETQNGFALVKVQDNGPGIPPEDLEKIFGKFHQVEASFTGQVEGAGLGLAFVKKVIEFHGGRVWLESRLSEGTTALFTLPRAPKG